MGLSFPAPFVDVFILPTDASTGTRIVIDGVNGRIEFYDASNNLVGLLRSNPTPLQYWGSGTGARIQIEPGRLGAYDSSGLERIAIITVGLGTPDIRYDGNSYPRGIWGGFDADTSDSARAPGVNTDMVVLANPILAGRRYTVHLHSQVGVGTGGFNALECTVDGTVVGQFWVDDNPSTNNMVDSHVTFEPAADIASPTVRVRNNGSSAGNLQMLAASDNHRTLYMVDEG